MKFLSNLDLVKNQLLNAVIQLLSGDPSNPTKGQIYFDTSVNRLKIHDGAAFKSVAHTDDALTPAAHTHDERYYTESELNTSGAGGQVHWNNLTNKPALGDMLKATYDPNDDGIVENAGHALTAEEATHAASANNATNAEFAGEADYATSASDANTVDGKHAADFAASGHNHDAAYGAKAKEHDPLTVTDTSEIDLTLAGQALSASLRDGAVTNARLSDMTAMRIKGRVTGGMGDPEDLTGDQARAIIGAPGLLTQLIGDGAATELTVLSNFGMGVIVQVQEVASGNVVYPDITVNPAYPYNIKIKFATAPAADSYRVVVYGI